jgi:hypothetical protein
MAIRVLGSLLALFLLCVYAKIAPQDTGQKEAERYIVESEKQWAESLANGDSGVPRRILADDFLGVEPDGTFYDKAKEIANAPGNPKEFLSNHLNDVKVRFYGDSAVAQGSESWVKRSGALKRGRYVWTDTWTKRNGQWQCVAAEDLTVLEPEK